MDADDGKKRSAIDDLSEGFETLRRFRFWRVYFLLAMMHIAPVVAMIYGAVAWKPYYLFLGAAGSVLLVIWHRMDPNPVKSPGPDENDKSVESPADDKP
jgi:hypothetical protein